ncbi:MAG: hypothetical protein ACKOA8_15700 [Deltaproteobacteria bacterium]|jgi:hypothetical protein
MKKGLLLFVFLFSNLYLQAQDSVSLYSEVISINAKEKTLKITHDNSAPWTVDDSVCVTRASKDIACGIVISTEQDLATVQINSQLEEVNQDTAADSEGNYTQLTFDYPTPQKGDSIRLVDKSPSVGIRDLASELKSNQEFGGDKIPVKVYDHLKIPAPFVPESNLTAGFNLLFPTVEYQQTFTDHSAVGVMPIFMNYSVGDGSIKGSGCFFNYHYYSEGTLQGYWGKVGLGIYGLTYNYQTKEDGNVVPALSVMVGKRLFKNNNLNFGFGAGGQYIFASTQTGLSFNGFIPSLVVDVGFAF